MPRGIKSTEMNSTFTGKFRKTSLEEYHFLDMAFLEV
jgi:hypothetical protein